MDRCGDPVATPGWTVKGLGSGITYITALHRGLLPSVDRKRVKHSMKPNIGF